MIYDRFERKSDRHQFGENECMRGEHRGRERTEPAKVRYEKPVDQLEGGASSASLRNENKRARWAYDLENYDSTNKRSLAKLNNPPTYQPW